MTEQTETRKFGAKEFAIALLIAIVLLALALLGITKNLSLSASMLQEDVVAITQMGEDEVSAMSIDEIQDARRTLSKVQGSDDFPESMIDRELQELDDVLATKMEEVIR